MRIYNNYYNATQTTTIKGGTLVLQGGAAAKEAAIFQRGKEFLSLSFFLLLLSLKLKQAAED